MPFRANEFNRMVRRFYPRANELPSTRDLRQVPSALRFSAHSQLKDERQVRPEIHAPFSPVFIKFNFEERCSPLSG